MMGLNRHQISHESFKILIGLERGDLKIPMEADMLFVRLSFVALFQFQLETLLKILLSKITHKSTPDGYYNIAKEILDILDIKNSKTKHNILNCLALMRNCLHSNGIHTKPSKTITVKGHKMKFVKGKSYHGGNLDEIHFMVNEVLMILEEILDHPKIQEIKIQLPNQFMPKLKS